MQREPLTDALLVKWDSDGEGVYSDRVSSYEGDVVERDVERTGVEPDVTINTDGSRTRAGSDSDVIHPEPVSITCRIRRAVLPDA